MVARRMAATAAKVSTGQVDLKSDFEADRICTLLAADESDGSGSAFANAAPYRRSKRIARQLVTPVMHQIRKFKLSLGFIISCDESGKLCLELSDPNAPDYVGDGFLKKMPFAKYLGVKKVDRDLLLEGSARLVVPNTRESFVWSLSLRPDGTQGTYHLDWKDNAKWLENGENGVVVLLDKLLERENA